MDISGMLHVLAEIQKEGKPGDYLKFLQSLSLTELGDLGGYGKALEKTVSQVVVKRISGVE